MTAKKVVTVKKVVTAKKVVTMENVVAVKKVGAASLIYFRIRPSNLYIYHWSSSSYRVCNGAHPSHSSTLSLVTNISLARQRLLYPNKSRKTLLYAFLTMDITCLVNLYHR